MAGANPASNTPSTNLAVINPPKLKATAWRQYDQIYHPGSAYFVYHQCRGQAPADGGPGQPEMRTIEFREDRSRNLAQNLPPGQ
jgi:hypothetical protein